MGGRFVTDNPVTDTIFGSDVYRNWPISPLPVSPNPNAGKLWLNFIMTDAGQTTFAEGFVRPSASLLVGFAVAWHLSALRETLRTALLFWISLPPQR